MMRLQQGSRENYKGGCTVAVQRCPALEKKGCVRMKHEIAPVRMYLMVTMLSAGAVQVLSRNIASSVTGISAEVSASNGGYSITGTTPAWTDSPIRECDQ